MTTQIPAFPSAAVIRRALLEFKIPAFDDQVLQIQQYIRILLVWNEKINLTAIRDPLEILYRHFCESMFAAEAIPLKNGRLADIGSGGGFPGLPLKIMRPGLQVFLVESNIKRVTFLAEVIRELRLNGAQVPEQIAAKQVILWIGGRDLEEIQKIRSWDWSEPIEVPHSLRRLLLVGTRKSSIAGASP